MAICCYTFVTALERLSLAQVGIGGSNNFNLAIQLGWLVGIYISSSGLSTLPWFCWLRLRALWAAFREPRALVSQFSLSLSPVGSVQIRAHDPHEPMAVLVAKELR